MKLNVSYFSTNDLKAIKQACECAEENTSGEVRVTIFNKRPPKTADLDLKQLAYLEFKNLGMEQTRDRTGILLFILLSERKFQILADVGISVKVEQAIWDEIAGQLIENFTKGEYLSGVVTAVMRIGEIMAGWFPRKADDTNELSDEVHVA